MTWAYEITNSDDMNVVLSGGGYETEKEAATRGMYAAEENDIEHYILEVFQEVDD